MRPSILPLVTLLCATLLLPACDSPKTSQPATASAKASPPPAEPVPGAAPVEVPPAAPAEPPVEPAPAAVEPLPAPAKEERADAAAAPATADARPSAAPEAQPSSPEAPAARTASEGRPAKVFTECRRSETFADGRCYASRDAACEALSCGGQCIDMRSMPPQVTCG